MRAVEMSRFRGAPGKMRLEKMKMKDLGRNWIKLRTWGFWEKKLGKI